MSPLSLIFCMSLELLRVTFHCTSSDLLFKEQHYIRSTDHPGGILFGDAMIGTLIDSAIEISLIDWGKLLLRLNLFSQL